MNYAGHQAHFLERLSRVDEEQTAFAMSLYYDAQFVSVVLENLEIPAKFDRVAIAIGADGAGPYVVLTRDGYFVTCLGERMKPRGLHVVAREKIEPLLSIRQAGRDSERRMEEAGWSRRTPWRVLRRRELALTREDFERLQEIRPLMMRKLFNELIDLPPILRESRRKLEVVLGRKLIRFRPEEEESVRNYWRSFFELHHLSVLLASDFEELTHLFDTETLVTLFGDLPLWSWREGMYGPSLRALWCAGRLGPFMQDHYLERLKSARSPHKSFLWLGACLITAFRHPPFRRPLLMVLRDWQYRTDSVPEENQTYDEGRRALLSKVGLEVLDQPKDREQYFTSFWAMNWLGHWFEETGSEDPPEELLEELCNVSAEQAISFAVYHLPEMRGHAELPIVALSAVPALARMSGAELFGPADSMGAVDGWDRDVALQLFQSHVEFRYVSDPVRVEKTPGRNDPCSCGSNRKYKRCCLRKRRMEGMEM